MESMIAECLQSLNLDEDSVFFIIAAVFAMLRDKRLIGICTCVLDINNTSCDHLYERKSLAEA